MSCSKYLEMKRRIMIRLKYLVSRNKGALVKILLVTTVVALTVGWYLTDATSAALMPPVIHQDLYHFRRSRNLDHYLKKIQVLIEPSTTACDLHSKLPLLVLVTSSPQRFDNREAIRNTWAKHVPTYFIMGLNGLSVEDLQTDNYIEAKMYSDVVVYDFADHYQNLTLKTALMLQWTLDRCPHAEFVFKTDDDVLINPWTMKKVLALHRNADLIGYRKEDTFLHRDEHNKWYLPRWLYYEDHISEYLSGTGYLINGNHMKRLLEAAYQVPLVNLEDVYLTYLVAKMKLGLKLTHDSRLSPYKPWLPLSCMYWGLASIHSLKPEEMLAIWPGLRNLGEEYNQHGKELCYFYARYMSSNMFLF